MACSWLLAHCSLLTTHPTSSLMARSIWLMAACSWLLTQRPILNSQRSMLTAYAGLEELRSWMRAELFLTNFRPIPLTEHAVFQGCIYSKASTLLSASVLCDACQHNQTATAACCTLLWASVLCIVYQHLQTATTAPCSVRLCCVILTSTMPCATTAPCCMNPISISKLPLLHLALASAFDCRSFVTCACCYPSHKYYGVGGCRWWGQVAQMKC